MIEEWLKDYSNSFGILMMLVGAVIFLIGMVWLVFGKNTGSFWIFTPGRLVGYGLLIILVGLFLRVVAMCIGLIALFTGILSILHVILVCIFKWAWLASLLRWSGWTNLWIVLAAIPIWLGGLLLYEFDD